MATQPDITPDKIDPQSPPETPVVTPPEETPFREPPEFDPPAPDEDVPDRELPETPPDIDYDQQG